MDYVINQVPFEMAEISGLLFNLQFLSDVTFIVDGKEIFAHSLELMKRSAKFIKQLEPTLSEKKLIPITDYGYDVFYQFVRFIYTDKYDLNDGNSDALLNLAKEYQVAGLINVVEEYKNIEFGSSYKPYPMKELSKQFFNFEYLSDITFMVEGKEIYAHSLELMKRSSVFQEQLESTMGEKKRVPITDYGYDIFFQFILFIYTDKCDINAQNYFELLKLAILYKISSLINFVQNSFKYDDFEVLKFCVLIKDQIALYGAESRLADNLKSLLVSDVFMSADQEVVATILKFHQMGRGIIECDKIDALNRWMKHHCTLNEIEFSNCREKFDKLIRLIRFPTISSEELHNIMATYPDLLTKSHLLNIRCQKIYGPYHVNEMFNCTPRLPFPVLKELPFFNALYTVKFSIDSDMILGGFIIGKYEVKFSSEWEFYFERVFITISCTNSEIDGINQTPINININNCKPNFQSTFYGNIINLGSSIRVRAGFTYTIGFKYVHYFSIADKTVYMKVRVPESEITINAPPKSIKIQEDHEAMLGMYFLKPDGTAF